MGRNEASDSIPRTDRERGRLQFIAGIALLLYGGAMLFDLAPTPSWYVYLVVGVGLFAWGNSQGVRELRWDRSLLFEWPPNLSSLRFGEDQDRVDQYEECKYGTDSNT